MYRSVLFCLVSALFLLGCVIGDEQTSAGSETGLGLIVVPDESGALPSDVTVGCRTGPNFPASALENVRPLDGSGLDEVIREVALWLENDEGQFWPQDGWLILDETESNVLVMQPGDLDATGDAVVWFMTVTETDGVWRWSGGGGGGPCPLVVTTPDDLNNVEWRLDPGVALTSDTTEVRILATELECASGKAMGDRLLAPEVVYTDDAILIAFAATPLEGGADCQGNPEQAVTVSLSEPVGDRTVRNGQQLADSIVELLVLN